MCLDQNYTYFCQVNIDKKYIFWCAAAFSWLVCVPWGEKGCKSVLDSSAGPNKSTSATLCPKSAKYSPHLEKSSSSPSDLIKFYFPWPRLIQGRLGVTGNSNISGNNCTNFSSMTHSKTKLVSNKLNHYYYCHDSLVWVIHSLIRFGSIKWVTKTPSVYRVPRTLRAVVCYSTRSLHTGEFLLWSREW